MVNPLQLKCCKKNMNEKMDIHDECLWMGYVLESEKALF